MGSPCIISYSCMQEIYVPQQKLQFNERIIKNNKEECLLHSDSTATTERGKWAYILYREIKMRTTGAFLSVHGRTGARGRLAESPLRTCQGILRFGLFAVVHGLSSVLQLESWCCQGSKNWPSAQTQTPRSQVYNIYKRTHDVRTVWWLRTRILLKMQLQVQISLLSFTKCMALGNFLNLSGPISSSVIIRL